MTIDHAKVRRESVRWNLINTLNKMRPHTSGDHMLLDVMRAIYPDATRLEVHRELSYLEGRKLIELDRRPNGHWFADLTHHGVDVAEYTTDCDPGIARPEKYWNE